MAKSSWIIFLSFVLGIITANLLGKDWFMTYGGLDLYLLKEISIQEISYDKYFLYVLWQRMKFVMILLVVSKLLPARVMGYGCWGFLAFSFGCLIAMAVLENGLAGMVIIVGAVFPQVIPYFVAFYLWQKHLFTMVKKQTYRYHNKNVLKKQIPVIAYYLIIFLCVICGVVLESYVGPLIFRKLI